MSISLPLLRSMDNIIFHKKKGRTRRGTKDNRRETLREQAIEGVAAVAHLPNSHNSILTHTRHARECEPPPSPSRTYTRSLEEHAGAKYESTGCLTSTNLCREDKGCIVTCAWAQGATRVRREDAPSLPTPRSSHFKKFPSAAYVRVYNLRRVGDNVTTLNGGRASRCQANSARGVQSSAA